MGMLDGKAENVSCWLENISQGGALVRMSDPVPETLREGDVIHLKAILLLPVELQCKVVRIEADQIAMHFLEF
jgi:c-di-GMP-binding flagellar brake protein YcgR